MTDPMTLLEARRPYVRDTLPGERVAARAVLEAAIQAERPAPVDAPAPAPAPARSPRRRIAALAGTVAAAAAAAAVGIGTLLWPSATPVAMGWDATPTVMAEDAAARVDARCRSTAGVADEGGLVVSGDADLVHVDQRGTTALATYVSDRPDNLWHVACLVSTGTGDWDDLVNQPMSLFGASHPADPADPGTEQLFPGPLVSARRGQVGDMSSVEGRVEASVAEVVVVHDGRRLATRLTDGFFTAFWPEPYGNYEALDVSVELRDASGQVLRAYDLPA